MHIALFGGSFNPPHVGHLLALAYVRAVAGVDAVWVMPAHRHPFGKKLAPFEDRIALCEALAAHVEGCSVTRIEEESPGDGRTVLTLEHLHRRFPEHRYSLVVGADIVHEAHKWFSFERVVELAPPIVLGRTGFSRPPVPTEGPLSKCRYLWDVEMPSISSTDVRAKLAAGEDVSQLVPRSVLQVIEAKGMYRQISPSVGQGLRP